VVSQPALLAQSLGGPADSDNRVGHRLVVIVVESSSPTGGLALSVENWLRVQLVRLVRQDVSFGRVLKTAARGRVARGAIGNEDAALRWCNRGGCADHVLGTRRCRYWLCCGRRASCTHSIGGHSTAWGLGWLRRLGYLGWLDCLGCVTFSCGAGGEDRHCCDANREHAESSGTSGMGVHVGLLGSVSQGYSHPMLQMTIGCSGSHMAGVQGLQAGFEWDTVIGWHGTETSQSHSSRSA